MLPRRWGCRRLLRMEARLAVIAIVALGACAAPLPTFVSVLGPTSSADPVGPYRIEAYVDAPAGVHRVACRWVTGDDLASYAELPMTLEGRDDSGPWVVEIPGQPPGTEVSYYLVLVDEAGGLVRYPAQAPEELLDFQVLTAAGD